MLTLPVVMFVHEVVTFGYKWGFLTGKRQNFAGGGGIILGFIVFFQLFMGTIAASVLAIMASLFYRTRLCVWVLTLSYMGAYFWAANGTASGYRANFGATWRFPEPFFELMLHPILTPVLTLIGVIGFLVLSRSVWSFQP